jgi:putative thioredoxin
VLVVDIDTASFEREVIEASKTAPVIVDFWAPWCGPCRALGPVLEKVAADFRGRAKLVKINSDENPELAAAYGIRSIPNVIAFKDGQPAAQFLGAVPEAQVRQFFEKLLPSPAEQALAGAESLFAAGRVEDAERELENVGADPALSTRIASLRQGIQFAKLGRDGPGEHELRAKLAVDPADHATRLALAGFFASQRRYREAMDELLEILRRAKTWRDGEARRQLLALFGLAANQPELVAEYRRKLASTLH